MIGKGYDGAGGTAQRLRYGRCVSSLTALEAAQLMVRTACAPLPAVDVDRRSARGLVLADDIVAAEAVPPFDNSAVDGYAVIAADLATASLSSPTELVVVGEIAAGAGADRPIGPGETIRIMTGAPIPGGVDAVAMVEDSERVGDDRVRLSRAVTPGTAVRRAGDDVRHGDVLFASGVVIRPAVEAVLASVNAQVVRVHPRVRVAVLSTGDELVDDGSALRPGQIRESNKTMLAGMLAEAGCIVVDHGIVRDDEAELERVLRRAAADCDAIVTSGGVSMGDYDVVKAVLGRIAEMSWMQIAIKPAKPFAFGTLDGTPIFGLPGNPVSSLVSFELLARPALRSMMGFSDPTRPTIRALADVDITRHIDGKTHFVRVQGHFADDGRYHVRPVGAQGSHQLAATATADAMIVLPDGVGVRGGDAVDAVLLHVDR
jgi:molybdopterin molybdotransferase